MSQDGLLTFTFDQIMTIPESFSNIEEKGLKIAVFESKFHKFNVIQHYFEWKVSSFVSNEMDI